MNGSILYAQTNDSDKTITLQIENKPIRQVLASITKQTGLRFSYNPNVLNEKKPVSIKIQNGSLDNVLKLILPDSISYKQISNYIILTSPVDEIPPDEIAEEGRLLEINPDSISPGKTVITIVDTVWIQDPAKDCDSILQRVLENTREVLEALTPKEPVPSSKGGWIIGISSGLRGEISFASQQERAFRNKRRISAFPLEFSFGYLFDDKFFLGSGIKYTGNYTNYSLNAFNWGESEIEDKRYLIYNSLQFPVDFKYCFYIGKTGLGIFAKAGINLSIPLKTKQTEVFTPDNYPQDSYQWTSPETGEDISVHQRLVYSVAIEAPLHKVNILGNIGLGFSYTFKFGLGFSLYAEYYAGMLNMARILIPYEQEQYNAITSQWESYSEGTEYVNFRGDYWNFGLEISYKFKRKKGT